MARTIGIGLQDFAKVITNKCFYVDKTNFIREWWDSRDDVTLITRPRRFGKTLNMSMVEQFFSIEYAGRGGLFEGLSIWKDPGYRKLQGTYPVISLSFARLERAIMTGITRTSKESIFSDLNHLEVVTTTSNKYATSFGFTEKEVFAALEEYGLSKEKKQVKHWYDGFIFGGHKDIYNPWSILNFLNTGKFTTYWANTSSNSLAGKLIQEGSRTVKEKFEALLKGESVQSPIDEQIVYSQLNGREGAIWSLLLASGYLKVLSYESYSEILEGAEPKYELTLTNLEVKVMFQGMIRDWFKCAETDYNDFIKALLLGDKKAMNIYMNRVALNTFSYFDTGKKPSGEEPERFYHGFVLGLLVDLQGRYMITSNRESGFGRYDVLLEPKKPEEDDGIILEFKVYDPEEEVTLKDTVQAALDQIAEKQYAARLLEMGIPKERIRCYGFAFCGKKVLIG